MKGKNERGRNIGKENRETENRPNEEDGAHIRERRKSKRKSKKGAGKIQGGGKETNIPTL